MPAGRTTIATASSGRSARVQLLTVTEVAAELRMSEWATRKLIRTGAWPARFVGRQWLTHPDALDAYLQTLPTNEP